MSPATLGLFLVGLALLPMGAVALVRGASRIASMFGLSPLVIGLTVVAYGTSSPELAVSVMAGLDGKASIAVANVVGSNILNVLLVLGICAVILPLQVARNLVRVDIPIMIAVSAFVWLMALDGRLGFVDGAILWSAAVGYTVLAIQISRKGRLPIAPHVSSPPDYDGSWRLDPARPVRSAAQGRTPVAAQEASPPSGGAPASGPGNQRRRPAGPDSGDGAPAVARRRGALAAAIAFVLGGLAMLVAGSEWLVAGAVALAKTLGIGDAVIGLTVVAIGTSLPEIVTSIVAALRGERDIALGNVVGSNIYNILGILGLTTLVTPGGLAVEPAMLGFDLPVMVGVALLCIPVLVTGFSIGRWEGGLFLLYYALYAGHLILDATGGGALPAYRRFAAAIVVLTALPVLGRYVMDVRRRRAVLRRPAPRRQGTGARS